MINDNNSNIIIELPESLDNAVYNLTDKPTATIGEVISDCFFLVFGGITQKAALRRTKYAIELEQFRNELQDEVNGIPVVKRIEPSIQSICTALDNIRYCVEEKELREMFAKLIANSINADKFDYVHPSYGEIIKQMTSFDAVLFKWFVTQNTVPVVRLTDKLSKEPAKLLSPICVIREEFNKDDISIHAAIDNLVRLRLIDINVINPNSKDVFKEMVEENYILNMEYNKYRHIMDIDNANISIEMGTVMITDFGRIFYTACN